MKLILNTVKKPPTFIKKTLKKIVIYKTKF